MYVMMDALLVLNSRTVSQWSRIYQQISYPFAGPEMRSRGK